MSDRETALDRRMRRANPRGRSLLSAALLVWLACALAAPAPAGHPVSITEAVVYVQREKVSVKLDVYVEDLYLFHSLKPNKDNFIEADALTEAREAHVAFLLDRFTLRNAAGEKLDGKLVTIDSFEMPAGGISMNDLMSYGYGYRFEYPVTEPLEFVTVSQQMVDESAGIPAEMQLRVKQEGSESPYFAVLNPGDPVTVRFNWEKPPLPPDASEEEWETWLTERREETLGITSYSAVYSFIYINDREVRHEILVPLATLESSVLIPRRDDAFLEVDEQPEAAEQIGAYFSAGNPVLIDGQPVTAEVQRVDFYGVDFRDFAQQAPQRRVSMASARAGVILSFPTQRPPEQVEVTWDRFNKHIFSVRSVVYAYDQTLNHVFSRYGTDQVFRWSEPNRPPLPAIQPVQYRAPPPPRLEIPAATLGLLASAPLLALALWWRGAGRPLRLAVVTAVALLAVLMWPVAHVRIDDPFAPPPKITRDEAFDVFARLHHNIYRAFDYHSENDIYDALARSVDGQLLEELYLQIQKGLAMQEQGGAISRIGQVRIVSSEPQLPVPFEAAQGFDFRCRWTVEGTVEHWGHIHARTNQYDAVFHVAERDEAWKITRVQLLGEERVNFETRLRGL
jgi:hypothetical protein